MHDHTAPETEASSGESPPGQILAPSPLLTLGAFLLGVAVEQMVPSRLLPAIWNWSLGGVLIGAGGLLFGGALWTMRQHDKHPSHADEPPALITDGPFRYSRNPIYVGHSLAHLGGSFLVDSLWPILTLVPVCLYLRHVVRQEEAHLRSRFGEKYEQYCRGVRRWL